jgi:hypothetical protein
VVVVVVVVAVDEGWIGGDWADCCAVRSECCTVDIHWKGMGGRGECTHAGMSCLAEQVCAATN